MDAGLFWSKDRKSPYQGQNDKAEERSPPHIKQMEVLAAFFFLFSEFAVAKRETFNLIQLVK